LGIPPSRKASADKCSGVLLWFFVWVVLRVDLTWSVAYRPVHG